MSNVTNKNNSKDRRKKRIYMHVYIRCQTKNASNPLNSVIFFPRWHWSLLTIHVINNNNQELMCVAPHLILLHSLYGQFRRSPSQNTHTHTQHTIIFSLSSNRFLSWLNNCPVYYRKKMKTAPEHTHTRSKYVYTNKQGNVRTHTHTPFNAWKCFVPIEMSKSSQFTQAKELCDSCLQL